MNILFIVPYVPNLIRVRPYNLIRHLAAHGHEVTVLTLWSTEAERADAEALKQHCHRVVALPLPRWRSLWNCLRALPTPVPLQAVYCWQPALARRLDFEIRNSTLFTLSTSAAPAMASMPNPQSAIRNPHRLGLRGLYQPPIRASPADGPQLQQPSKSLARSGKDEEI